MIKKTLSTAFLLLLYSSCCFAFPMAEEEKVETVMAVGMGADKKASVDSALVSAVEQAVGIVITTDVHIKNMEVIGENIAQKSAGFIKKYEILSVSKENGAVRTVIVAEILVIKLRDTFKSLNIATFEVADAGALYARELPKSASIENVRKYINNDIQSIFRPMSKVLAIDIKSIEFDEGNAKNKLVPYTVLFNLSVDTAGYENTVAQFVSALEEYSIAAERAKGSRISTSVKEYYLDSEKIKLNSTGSVDSSLFKEGDIGIAFKHGQNYAVTQYGVSYDYMQDIGEKLDVPGGLLGRLKDIKVRVQLQSGSGSIISEEIVPLFAPGAHKVAVYFTSAEGKTIGTWLEGEQVAVQNVIFSKAGWESNFDLVAPYIYLKLDRNTTAGVREILMGYHGTVSINEIKNIKNINIEFL